MKKNLIKQAKKSLSLFLAVLMLMSCWVWVAPEKAEAGSVTATTYKVTVKWQLADRSGKYTGGNIMYKTLGNGWGSESGEKTAISSLKDYLTNNKSYEYSFETTDFPSVVKISYEGGNTNWGALTQDANKARCELLEILINGKSVWKGNFGYNGANSAEVYPTYANGDAGTTGGNSGTYSWPRPMIAGFEDSTATADDINVTLNKIGGANVEGSTSFDISKYTCYDQYGVAVPSDFGHYCTVNSQTTYVSGTKNSDDATSNTDIWSKGDNEQTVVVSPNLQISDPKGTTGKAEYYLVRKYVLDDCFGGEQTSKVSSKVTVTYPKYDVKFDAVLSQAVLKTSSETLGTGSFTASNYNGGTIAVPTKAEADGYTFHGFWSKPQPTSGDASYNALEANFANPCSTEDYNSYKETGTESNGIVTDSDGKKWYDAGIKLDPSTAKTINVEGNATTPNDESDDLIENWYGWWISKDLSVKFYDVDGAFLGEKVVKSGQTQSDIAWPTSKYIDSGYTTGAFKFKVDGNIWENYDGTEIKKNSHTFTKDLILTPKLTRESFTDKYSVSFINPNTGASVAVGTEGGNYDYRQNITERANEALGKIVATPNDVNSDLQYSYELLGWSSVAPTTGKNYHVLLEDADFDVNGTSIGLNSDWVVRNTATYYAVYRRHTKTYVVNFNYKDATGTDATRQLKVKYGATLVPPTDYVPYTYVTKGFGYTFDKWAYATAAGDAELGYAATIPFTSEYIQIEGAALDDGVDVEPINITAGYGDPVATPYTVKFNYVDDEGEDVSKSVEVRNEQFILQTTVDSLKPAEKWDHEDNLYTYANKWEITEGSATVGKGGAEKKVGDIVDTADLSSLTPTSNITFKAVYADPKPFYTVTYIDGVNTYSERVLVDSNVPAWTYKATNDNGTPDDKSDDFEEDKIYVPKDYEGNGGTYMFQGWFDQKQTDETYKTINGNKVTTADKVTGNLTLYSQFKFVPDKFLIKFMNHDGTVQLGAGEFEKGQSIEALVTTATKAAQGRTADETYTYLFLGWDKPVPTFCEGYAVTFTAQYKPVYRYYDVKWYNSNLVDGKWVADKSTSEVDGETVETNLLATTHHTYNSKLYTPAVDNLVCPETAPAGQNYVFAGWYYNDAEGNAVKYERGMVVTAEMEFYATYTLTNKVYTVTTVVKGVETKYSVASGNTAEIPDPQAGYVDSTKHDAFAGWFTDKDCTAAFDAETVITADTKIYAKFTEGAHDFTEKELKTAPTYYAEGEMDVWCSCDKAQTKKTESINKLTDNEIPTGTIYLGDKSWSSEGEPAYNTDNDPISIFVNENTDVIITANDTGDVDPLYNPSGIGIGVKYIRAFAFPAETVLTADNYGAAQQLALDVYKDETEDLTNNANFAVKLGDFIVADLTEDGKVQYNDDGSIKYKRLESGESYIIYYYVVDKAGKQLDRKVRTAKFMYDNDVPDFTVEGESNGAVVPTYCGTATVTDLEKDVVLTLNGKTVDVVYENDATTGTYEIKYAEGTDNIIITATDKAGNSFSKKIKVAEHSYLVTEQKSSCGVAGYKKEECIVCGDIKTNVDYPALDHAWGMPEVIPADCVNIGSVVVTCGICGEKVTTVYEEDGETPVVPALGHVFAKNADDEIIYTTVTESTCKTAGLAEAYCTECNGELEGGYITTALELDSKNHEDVTVTEVEPDCINNGYYTKACSCGVTIEHKDHETDPDIYAAKGHGTIEAGTAEWYVRIEPTCYEKGEKVLKCLVCSNFVEIDGEEVTEEIEATGEHVKTVTNPDTYKEDGEVRYHCATDGCPHKYDPKPYVDTSLEKFTVTFYAEDGTTELYSADVLEGSYIAKDAVTAPEKANSADGVYKYSFAGWVEVITDKDGKTSDGATYKLPLEVTKDMALKATYKATTIKYTHQFMVQDTWNEAREADTYVEYKTLVGAIGEERVPSGTPVFTHKDSATDAELKELYTYKFLYWTDANGVKVDDFTITFDADAPVPTANATFYAKFERTPIQYSAIYYNGEDYFSKETVNAGETAPTKLYERDEDGNYKLDENGDKIELIPERDYDDTYHYAFSGKWYTDSACQNEYEDAKVKGNIRLYAGFTATEHTLEIDTSKGENGVIKAADCTENAVIAIKCSNCDYTAETEYAIANGKLSEELYEAAKGHKEATKQVTGEDGIVYTVVYCTVCGAELSSTKTTFVITFKTEEGEVIYEVELNKNDPIEYTAIPEKEADEQYTYTFDAWYLGEEKIENGNFGNADAEKTFVAKFTRTTRKYLVSYFAADFKTIIKSEEVEYGSVIPAAPETNPTKESTENSHFTFDRWSVAANTVVKGDIAILPVFITEDHDFKKTDKTANATCTEPGGDVYKCEGCGMEKASGGTPATGHKFKEIIENVPATYEEAGYIIKKCENCEVTDRTEIPQRQHQYINVTVKDAKGNPVEGAKVDLYRDGTWIEANFSNAQGKVTFEVGDENYKYTVLISGVDGLEKNEYEVVGGGDVEPDFGDVNNSCGCSCHRAGFWGIVFRFFHKVISWFTGRIGCCSCPDEAY